MRQPNKKMIGLFILIGLTAFIGMTLFLLKDKIFKGDDVLVMYFDESIKGLNVGAPVVFEGVEVGKVSGISLLTDVESLSFNIPVFVRINPKRGVFFGSSESVYNRQRMINSLIDRGLRARLSMQSFLTGQLMIELTMLPNTKPVLKGYDDNMNDDAIEVPTVLSAAGSLSRGLASYPFEKSLEKFSNILDNLDKQMPPLLTSMTSLSDNLDYLVSNNNASFTDLIDNMNQTAIDVSDTLKSIRELTDYIERHPEAFLTGKGE